MLYGNTVMFTSGDMVVTTSNTATSTVEGYINDCLDWFGELNWTTHALIVDMQNWRVEAVDRNGARPVPCHGHSATVTTSDQGRNLATRITDESIHHHKYAMRGVRTLVVAGELHDFWRAASHPTRQRRHLRCGRVSLRRLTLCH